MQASADQDCNMAGRDEEQSTPAAALYTHVVFIELALPI
jgi:hypothetical protein